LPTIVGRQPLIFQLSTRQIYNYFVFIEPILALMSLWEDYLTDTLINPLSEGYDLQPAITIKHDKNNSKIDLLPYPGV